MRLSGNEVSPPTSSTSLTTADGSSTASDGSSTGSGVSSTSRRINSSNSSSSPWSSSGSSDSCWVGWGDSSCISTLGELRVGELDEVMGSVPKGSDTGESSLESEGESFRSFSCLLSEYSDIIPSSRSGTELTIPADSNKVFFTEIGIPDLLMGISALIWSVISSAIGHFSGDDRKDSGLIRRTWRVGCCSLDSNAGWRGVSAWSSTLSVTLILMVSIFISDVPSISTSIRLSASSSFNSRGSPKDSSSLSLSSVDAISINGSGVTSTGLLTNFSTGLIAVSWDLASRVDSKDVWVEIESLMMWSAWSLTGSADLSTTLEVGNSNAVGAMSKSNESQLNITLQEVSVITVTNSAIFVTNSLLLNTALLS